MTVELWDKQRVEGFGHENQLEQIMSGREKSNVESDLDWDFIHCRPGSSRYATGWRVGEIGLKYSQVG
jgi:hypothetical protein